MINNSHFIVIGLILLTIIALCGIFTEYKIYNKNIDLTKDININILKYASENAEGDQVVVATIGSNIVSIAYFSPLTNSWKTVEDKSLLNCSFNPIPVINESIPYGNINIDCSIHYIYE